MPYIFLNPVVKKMYKEKSLLEFLSSRAFVPVECEKDWISEVLAKYKKAIENSPLPLVDMRCPLAVALVKEKVPDLEAAYPEIEPILIHCAREISKKYSHLAPVVITSPCRSLAEYGNFLGLVNTRFVSWNDFVEENSCQLKKTILQKSPIPPGFFSKIEEKALSVSGRENILRFFAENKYKDSKIVELLYCQDGCNNGDGVL